MPTLVTNVTALPQVLPPTYGGAVLAAAASVTVNDLPANVASVFALYGLSPANWSFVQPAQAGSVPTFELSQEYLYVSPTGDPSQPGTNPALPTTLANAVALLLPGMRVVITCAPGTYTVPATLTFPANCQVTLAGQYAVQLGGVKTVGNGSTTTAVVDGTGGMTVNASRGDRIRMLTGALAGQIGTIRTNTATTFNFFNTMTGAAANGDTYVVERTSVVFTWAAPAAWDISEMVLLVDAVEFQWTTASQFRWFGRNGEVRMRGCRLNKAAFTQPMQWFGCCAVLGSLAPMFLQAIAGTGSTNDHGCFATSTAISIIVPQQGARFYAQNLVAFNINVNSVTNAEMSLAGFDGINSPIYATTKSTLLLQGSPDGQTNALSGAFSGTDAITVDDGSIGSLSSTVITSWTGNAVTISRGSQASCALITGTGSTGHGCNVIKGSQLYNVSSNTVAGADQVQVGGAASAVNWSTITTYTDDHAAGTPQGCSAYA